MTKARAVGHSVRLEAVAGWVAAATAVLLVYVLVVLGGGVLVGRTESPHLGLSILATVVVATVAEPVRLRFERLAGRVLHRREHSPYDVLAQFSREVSGTEAVEQMPAVITRMLATGLDVARAESWLLVHGRLTLVGCYPPGAEGTEPPTLLDGAADGGGLRSVTVAHAGRPLGVLRVEERDGRRLTSVEERLFGGLAAQAGLVLQTAQLRAELSETLSALSTRERQLRRSRDELVVTQDLERRRLERDIHDGAQQQLVALTINLKLVKAILDTDPRQALAVLDEQAVATDDAIATLSDLSHGLLPGVLGELGVAPALADATSGNPTPVRVEAAGVGRLPAAVEAALYFCSLEAVQNATKHAQASGIDVRLQREADGVVLSVEDDGVGLPAGAGADTGAGPAPALEHGPGSGLDNMRHRIGSVGGHLTITSEARRGTTVTATVPLGAAPAAWRS